MIGTAAASTGSLYRSALKTGISCIRITVTGGLNDEPDKLSEKVMG